MITRQHTLADWEPVPIGLLLEYIPSIHFHTHIHRPTLRFWVGGLEASFGIVSINDQALLMYTSHQNGNLICRHLDIDVRSPLHEGSF